MSSFFGGSGSGSVAPPADMAQRKEQMKQSIQQELAVANAQSLINKINENCFDKCVKPSTSLTTSEEACLSRCMALYTSAFDLISQKYVARVTRERAGVNSGELKL